MEAKRTVRTSLGGSVRHRLPAYHVGADGTHRRRLDGTDAKAVDQTPGATSASASKLLACEVA